MGGVVGILVLILGCVGMAVAQQPTKIPRIGYLGAASASVARLASRRSAKGCASLGTWRGKTLSLSIDLQRENSIASPRLRPS